MRKLIREYTEELSNDFQDRGDYYMYTSVERTLMEIGKKIMDEEPLNLSIWIYSLLLVADTASKGSVLGTGVDDIGEDIPWVIERIAESIGQVQHTLSADEEVFAKVLAVLMYVSDEEAVKLGLGLKSHHGYASTHEHPYKNSPQSPIFPFDDHPSPILPSLSELGKKAEKEYQSFDIGEENMEEYLAKFSSEELAPAIKDTLDEEN